jgi:S-adenosylmethionine synthetase
MAVSEISVVRIIGQEQKQNHNHQESTVAKGLHHIVDRQLDEIGLPEQVVLMVNPSGSVCSI